ncbi:hypothetical protein B0T17DRAFT_69023 [Bombardia bombarda]|uniref:PID domain-containing protein n=1 Tax=Bombardia bombarda TaxID=252184 RepID=A0AA39XLA7_9PEZI|nr:hypothetical protein B0T17DRAFT_69023 [Bombardia bombarda]
MATRTSISKAPPAPSDDFKRYIRVVALFDAADADKNKHIDASETATPEFKYDKLAVDIFVINSGLPRSVFGYEKQSALPNGPSGPQETSRFGSSKPLPRTQSRRHTWLTDEDMIPSHITVGRIVHFDLDLKRLHSDAQKGTFSDDLMSIASVVGQQLMDIREKFGSRPMVFIGHGYGTVLIERLLSPDLATKYPKLKDFAVNLQDSIAAICLFAAPYSISPLLEWSARVLRVGRDSRLFGSVQIPVSPELWKGFRRQMAASGISTLIFREKESENEGEKEKGRLKAKERERESEKEKEKQIAEKDIEQDAKGAEDLILDEVEETEHSIDDIAMMSGPRDKKFVLVVDALTKAIHCHQFLAAAKQDDKEKVVHLVSQNVDVNLPNVEGQRPLHLAILYGKHDVYAIVKELLEAGADPNLKGGKNNKTPREIAESLLKEAHSDTMMMVRDLLENPPPVSPLRLMRRLIKEDNPSTEALNACRKTVMVVREMFQKGSYIPYYTNVEQLIYKTSGDEKQVHQGAESSELKTSLDDYFKKQADMHAKRNGSSLDDPVCRWYHVPMNNMAWIHDLFASLNYHVWPWPRGYREFTFPYSRAVYPQVARLKPLDENAVIDESKAWAIMMPYISYEEYGRQAALNKLVRQLTSVSHPPYSLWAKWGRHYRRRQSKGRHRQLFWRLAGLSAHNMSSRNVKETMPSLRRHRVKSSSIKGGIVGATKAYLNYKHTKGYVRNLPLHPRRTLDQSYYYMLRDTTFRDRTQVVSRWFNKSARNSNLFRHSMSDEHSRHNILMVDQLWLWVFCQKGQPDTVISSFPIREGAERHLYDDLQQQILQDEGRDPLHTTSDLVKQIMAACCRTLSPNQASESVNFYQSFESSIAHVEETSSRLFQEFRLLSMALSGLEEDHPQYQKQRRILLGELLDTMSKETASLTEVKDIIDEIKIIQTTLEEQTDVIESDDMRKFEEDLYDTDKPGIITTEWHPSAKARDTIRRTNKSFKAMMNRAEAVEKSIDHLLDLKQKQANLWEARTSREAADENAIQGNTLLVFTIVTIIFLPLSFMSSFFAISVDKFPKDADGDTNWPLSYVCALVFGISFAVSIPFILIALLFETLRNVWLQIRHFWMKVLVLPIIHLLSRVPFLYNIGHRWWKGLESSAQKHHPNNKSRIKKLLERDRDDLDAEMPDKDTILHVMFGKQLRRYDRAAKLDGSSEDTSDDSETDSELD